MMEIISAIIVDDEPEARDIIANLLADFSDVEVLAKEDCVNDALISIKSLEPDLVFLDIGMPRKNGFQLLKELKFTNFQPTVIFVTAYNQYAIEAIKHAAFDYLVKPVDIDDLKETLNRYRSEKKSVATLGRIENLLHALQEEKLQFNTRTGYIYINPAEIVYCKAEGNYTDLFLSDNQKETVTINIGRIENILPLSKFLKINRSMIINKLYLSEINRKDKICILRVSEEEIAFGVSPKYFGTLSQ